MPNQITDTILMIRPKNFGSNPETAPSNAFQETELEKSPEKIEELAVLEFDRFVETLREAGVDVRVIEDTREPVRPDAVFPNNWITTHSNGTMILYPALGKSRRLERREDITEWLRTEFGFDKLVDWSPHELKDRFLEGTGSMILDRVNRLVYACVSPRTHPKLLNEFINWADYDLVVFRAVDKDDVEIYHTNVMMALAETFVIICLDAVSDIEEKKLLIDTFARTKKEIVEISFDQMLSFAGNMLQVKSRKGEPILVMSTQAYNSLNQEQIKQIERHCAILHSSVETIEKYGGGSARCMLAEIFIPEKS